MNPKREREGKVMIGKKPLEQISDSSEADQIQEPYLDEIKTSDPVSLFSDKQEL